MRLVGESHSTLARPLLAAALLRDCLREVEREVAEAFLLDGVLSETLDCLLLPFFCEDPRGAEEAALVFVRADVLSFFDFFFFVTVVSNG